jgi:tRNA pseudouridine55 synthase
VTAAIIGPRTIEHLESQLSAADVEAIRAAAADDPAALERLLLPIDAGLDGFPRLAVDGTTIAALARGQAAALPAGAEPPAEGPILVIDDDGRLVAVATLKDGRLAPDKVLVDASPPAGARV